MVKTRGNKRASPKPPEAEADQCIQKKKLKLDNTVVKSKYFVNDTSDENVSENTNMKDSGLDLDEGMCNLSNESEESVVFQRPKIALKIKDESDSESSSDEFMKAPISLDDLGGFETLKKENVETKGLRSNAICSSSVSRLSDNSDEDQETNDDRTNEYYDFSQIIQSQELIMNTKKEQGDKCDQQKLLTPKKVKNKSSKVPKKTKSNVKTKVKSIDDERLNVSELLAMAEGTSLGSKGFSNNSESEDENEEIKTEDTYYVPKEGVQVTIELPVTQQKRKSKGFDMEAAMKRRLNLIRKENQVLMHKVHTLCWLAHGVYLNRTINSENLIALALSLIPSKHCYPSKHADLNYLEQLVGWFVNKITIAKDRKLFLNNSKQSLYDILETAIKAKVALSHRDLVLIFVCMVRCLGIDARLVVSLRPVPLRPPLSDLCTVSNKPKEEKRDSDAKQKKITTPLKRNKIAEKTLEKVNKKGKQMEQSNFKPVKLSTINKKSHCKSLNKPCLEVKSSYFSSSDELPLIKLKNKDSAGNVSVPPKMLNEKKSPSGGKGSHKSVGVELNLKSPYFNSDIQRNKKLTTNLNTMSETKEMTNYNKISPEKSEAVSAHVNRPLRNRKSAPASLCEIMSSEDEVEIPKKVIRLNQNKCSPRSSNNSKNAKKNLNTNLKKKTMDEDDFELPKATSSKKKPIDRRVLSSDDEKSNEKKIGSDYWAEVFLEAEEKWISVDLRKGKVHCIQQLYNGATQPVRYVIACNNDGTMKDVTRRYAPQWLTVTRRQRIDEAWWRETVAPFTPRRTHRDREEDEDLDRQMHDKPLPSSIAEYKNHPLFALQRHLLKFEAIYPPDAPPLGFIRSEPVYSRGCVVDLHTRETWIKEAKLVRRDTEPYKIVKARPKWDKLSGRVINDLPLPLFGHWQVEDYIPPPAVDGKVPRNEYGNVELYKPCMLPPGTVHLQVPQLARVARKLDIDCAPAVVGWEFSGGSSHPVLDGFIVCEEFKEILLDAWDKEMDESAKRAKEKKEQRVYGNWKRLIKGLLIRERLKLRYDFGAPDEKTIKKKQQPKPSTSKS